jgi:hypothetical protein
MACIHEIAQVLFVNTPHGDGQALFIIDYGPHVNSWWVVANKADGVIRHYDTNSIQVSRNCTMDLNMHPSALPTFKMAK